MSFAGFPFAAIQSICRDWGSNLGWVFKSLGHAIAGYELRTLWIERRSLNHSAMQSVFILRAKQFVRTHSCMFCSFVYNLFEPLCLFF